MSVLLSDLPPEVITWAERVGAVRAEPGSCSELRQVGRLRPLGSAKWMRFSARQSMRADTLAFRWRAWVGPLRAVRVEDALIDGSPVGLVRVLGLIPLSRAMPSTQLLKGNLQRYLAELPWNPDALLSNPALQWRASGNRTLRVAASLAGAEGSVEFTLGADGLPRETFAVRPAAEGGSFVERAWFGAFDDYQDRGGRRVPLKGRVAWALEGERFEVWRGTITSWSRVAGG